MAQSDYTQTSLADHYGTLATHGAIFTTVPADDNTPGTEPTGGSPAYARIPLVWDAPVDGVSTAVAKFDVPAGTTIVGTGIFDALTAGNYIQGKQEASLDFPSQDTVTVTFTYTQV